MVEKRSKERKKRKRKVRVGQTITQKVIVNLGNTAPRRRTGTQAKRSVQPQQVTYQNSPIPLIPDYSSQLNDLRNEVRASRIVSIAQPEQRTGIIAPKEKIEKIAKQEGMQGTDVQTERVVGGLMEEMLGKLELEELTEQIEKRTAEIASGKITKKKGRTPMSAEEKAARKESREFAKRDALSRPVVGIPIPEAVQQVAELKPREFQEGSLLAEMEGAVRLPRASKLKKRVLYKTYDADPQDPQEDPSFV